MADSNLAFLILLPLALLLLLLILIVRPRPAKIPIKNRHVFITGGSSGIGLALALRAAADGARVSILARSLDKLEDARNQIQLSTGISVSVFAADVRDFAAVSEAAQAAGPIDVLIVNQGVFIPGELDKQGLDDVRFMLDVNLIGSFNMIKAALPGMKNRKDRGPGSLALMSSQAGQVGIYGYTAYSASKFGLRGLAEALQQELIAEDIHVSLIFPPDTDTPGLVEETKKRPQLTSIIAESSGSMKAEDVAKKAFDGIRSGSFIVPCNFEGTLLSIATAGLAPQRSFVMAFVEVVAAGVIRIAALCFQWSWYTSILKWHAQNKMSCKASELLRDVIGGGSQSLIASLRGGRSRDEGVSSKFSTTPLKDIFKDRKVVIFGLPGAYTGVCSQQHVPSYKNNIGKFKAKGIDSVICVAVNDPFVLNGWANQLQAKDSIEFYGDFDGSFHKSLDLGKDLSVALLGPRSQRWSAYVVDGKVKVLNVEEAPSDFKVSGGDTILGQI